MASEMIRAECGRAA